MADKMYELDGLTARLISDNLVCPYISDCRFYRLCNHPDHNALYHATHFCGDKYLYCQVYGNRSSKLPDNSPLSCLESNTSRASPEEDDT